MNIRVIGTVAIVTLMCSATAGELPAGAEWGDSVEDLRPGLTRHCESTRAIEVSAPSFPLAAREECHLLCYGLRTDSGVAQQSVFVFADDELVMIEARNGATKALARTTESNSYMHYQIYDDGEQWHDTDEDTVWLLSKAARHPNLSCTSTGATATRSRRISRKSPAKSTVRRSRRAGKSQASVP